MLTSRAEERRGSGYKLWTGWGNVPAIRLLGMGVREPAHQQAAKGHSPRFLPAWALWRAALLADGAVGQPQHKITARHARKRQPADG